MKRIIAILMAVLMMTALLAACGSSDSDKATEPATTAVADPTAADPGSGSNTATDANSDNNAAAKPADDPAPVDGPADNGDADSAVGTYYFKSLYGVDADEAISTMLSQTNPGKTLEDFLSELGISSSAQVFMIELRADSSATATSFLSGHEQSQDGSWTQNGSTVTITIDNDPEDFILNGNEITSTDPSMQMVLEK